MRFMRFIIWNTFFTLVADDNDDVTQESCPPRPRRHSAPPTLTYAEPERAVFQSKQHKHRRRRKEARARQAKDAAESAAADEVVSAWRRGESVLMHCNQGYFRSPVAASREAETWPIDDIDE